MSSQPPDPRSSVFVGALSHTTTDASLARCIAQFGRVSHAHVARRPDGSSRGFGTVSFSDAACVELCVGRRIYLDGKLVEIKNYSRSARDVQGHERAPRDSPHAAHASGSAIVEAAPSPTVAFPTTLVELRQTLGPATVCVLRTQTQVQTMCDFLAATSRTTGIAVDAHGVLLGRSGKLAWLQLCGSNRDVVFCLDIDKLGPGIFRRGVGLRRLLEDPDMTKLFFDCRADVNYLYFVHGVSIPPSSVQDIQCLGAAAAIVLGVESPLHLRTLRPGGPRLLPGFAAVIKSCGSVPYECISRTIEVRNTAVSLYSQDSGGNYNVWFETPLRDALLEHIAEVRYYHDLRDEITSILAGRHMAAAAAAVSRRFEVAQSTGYESSSKDNAILELQFVNELTGRSPISPAPSSPGGSQSTAASSASTSTARETESSECSMCLSEPPSHAFLPCGHKCVCGECAQQVNGKDPIFCILCRKAATSLTRIFG